MDSMKDLNELCEILSRAINTANEKIRGANGKLSTGDADYIDKLTHSLKSIKSVMAMDEADMYDGYSGERGYPRGGMMRGYSRDGGYSNGYDYSYGPGRGRGSNARRDSMGRYSNNDGYSRGGNMADELRDLMNMAPDEQTRQQMQDIVRKLEQR